MKTFKGRLNYSLTKDLKYIIWVLEVDNKSVGINGIIPIVREDELKVLDHDDRVIFNYKIEPDFSKGKDPKTGKQRVFGFNVQWIQFDWTAENWARLFIPRKSIPHFRAELKTNRKI